MANPIGVFAVVVFWALFCMGVSANELQDLHTQVKNEAFKVLHHKRTGIPYNVSVPPLYSGVTAQAIRLRTGSLRRRGVKIHEFRIPKEVVVEGNPRSVVMVYKSFGHNNSYFSTMGYKFIAPVVGLLVYNASVNPASESQPELKLMAMDNQISIKIPIYVSSSTSSSCARFDSRGALSNTSEVVSPPDVCNFTQLGHFSIVIPINTIAPQSTPAPESPTFVESKGKKGSSKWKIALGAVVGGIVALLALFLLILWGRKEVDRAKIAKMERHADNEETLQTSLIGNSRAPVAAGTRTRPILENEDST